jgi:hypothetical protein
LYQFVNKIKGFLLAIIIEFSILEVLEKLNPRKKKLIIKKYLYLIEGREFILIKPAILSFQLNLNLKV